VCQIIEYSINVNVTSLTRKLLLSGGVIYMVCQVYITCLHFIPHNEM